MKTSVTFTTDHPAVQHLAQADERMGKLIATVGPLTRELDDDLFSFIAESIIFQQLAMPAAQAIWQRVLHLLDHRVLPQSIQQVDDDAFRTIGLSHQKIRYLRSLADMVASGAVDLDSLPDRSDEEVIGELTRITGVGRWTAEMVLIFSLGRPDVISFGDLGLREAVRRLYHVEGDLTRALFDQLTRPWSPHRTVAAFYLWAAHGIRA